MSKINFIDESECELCDKISKTATFVENGLGTYICEECYKNKDTSCFYPVKIVDDELFYLDSPYYKNSQK